MIINEDGIKLTSASTWCRRIFVPPLNMVEVPRISERSINKFKILQPNESHSTGVVIDDS